MLGPKKGALVANKYRLERLVARGGMGAVWEAWDSQLERPVAIKFMDLEIANNPLLRQRFNREAKAAARLRTPYVVQVYEHGVDGDTPFIVMELLEGQDLHRRLRDERRIPIAQMVPIVQQIARALRVAQEAGIIHRDLKPQNVFLSSQDDELMVKILDFGVAKLTDSQLAGEGTKTGIVVGSPHYMSPEQARGLPSFDHRSDVWSLGVIIFKAVTGHRPFKGQVAGDVIVKICAEPVPKASKVKPGLPLELDDFFSKALERDPDKRYQTATELAAGFAETVKRIAASPA
ncbi:MAG: serine/threonine protein kinase, partial [Deltaproteobacteria bacterium]|nr:serine/threonine protein kinase [Deltaproteobacteria bacterium]